MKTAAFLFSLILGSSLAAQAPTSQLLFDSGKEGYPRYRIPSLIVTKKGTVLAICEGRKDGRGLTGNIDIVVKRSFDSGKTWQPLQSIADDGANTLGNPCVVVDRDDGTIWLGMSRSLGTDTEEQIVSKASKDFTRAFITFSKDDGATWAPIREITAGVRKDNFTWYGTGPGIGLHLRSGRLVLPSYHAEAGTKTYRCHMVYSDDRGQTWKLGGIVGEHASEPHIVEKGDGSIHINARTVLGVERRTIADSKDGGLTWSEGKHDVRLYDPHCQASLYRDPELTKEGKTRWLFCHPAGPGRRELTVRTSFDEGKTWSAGKLLRSGDSQYSCLARLPSGEIGCLHESWVEGNYRLFFIRFTTAWTDEN